MADIIARLHQYSELDDNKQMKTYEQKRAFKWKNRGEQDGIACLASPLLAYYHEKAALEALKVAPGKVFEQLVPFFDQATEALKMIQSIASLGTNTQVSSNIEQILNEISKLRPRVRNSIRDISDEFARNTLLRQGNLAAVGIHPVSELKIGLYQALDDATNLTIENMCRHTIQLLRHFDIPFEDSEDPINALRILVLRDKKKPGLARAIAYSWRKEYLEGLAATGNIDP